MTRPVLAPTAEHPISILPTEGRVTVRVGGHVVADTTAALTLRESTYSPVQYIPRADLDEAVLEASDHTTYCPYKGDATYLSVAVPGGAREDDVIWTYEDPFEAVAQIGGHVAFYANRAEVTVEEA